MRIPDSARPFLEGKKFSNGLIVDYDCKPGSVLDRQSYLIEKSRNRSVLHIGFADHLPLIDQKIASRTWLHKELQAAASACIGVDIDREAVQYCREKHGIENVFAHDIIQDPPLSEITAHEWDVAVLGEILEHIASPADFLSRLKLRYGSSIRKLIITVPNAWDVTNLRYVRLGKEYINSDHRYWFTPYTIAKIVCDAGLEVVDIAMARNSPVEDGFLHRLIRRRWPMVNETIIVECRFT